MVVAIAMHPTVEVLVTSLFLARLTVVTGVYAYVESASVKWVTQGKPAKSPYRQRAARINAQ